MIKFLGNVLKLQGIITVVDTSSSFSLRSSGKLDNATANNVLGCFLSKPVKIDCSSYFPTLVQPTHYFSRQISAAASLTVNQQIHKKYLQ